MEWGFKDVKDVRQGKYFDIELIQKMKKKQKIKLKKCVKNF